MKLGEIFFVFFWVLLFFGCLIICFGLYYTNMPIVGKIVLSIICLVSFLVTLLAPNPSLKPVSIPEHAEKLIIPDRGVYLSVWKEDSRVHIVFANMPWAKLSFDYRASHGLSEILGKI